MKNKKIENLLVRVKDEKGKEGWVSMIQFGEIIIGILGETINKEMK